MENHYRVVPFMARCSVGYDDIKEAAKYLASLSISWGYAPIHWRPFDHTKLETGPLTNAQLVAILVRQRVYVGHLHDLVIQTWDQVSSKWLPNDIIFSIRGRHSRLRKPHSNNSNWY